MLFVNANPTMFPCALMLISCELSLVPMLQPSGRLVAAFVPLSARTRVSPASGVASLSAAMVRVIGDSLPPGIVSVPPPSVSSTKLAPLFAVMAKSLPEMPSPLTSTRRVACAVRALLKLRARVVLLPSSILASAGLEKAKMLSLGG